MCTGEKCANVRNRPFYLILVQVGTKAKNLIILLEQTDTQAQSGVNFGK